jgi:hypothetical protein
MTVYVIRKGKLVEKMAIARSKRQLPEPYISRLEPYESPIDGKEITSWGQRDRDLKESNSYDPRDLKNERPEQRQLTLPFGD